MCHVNMERREGKEVYSIGHCTGKRRHGRTSKGQGEITECLGLVSKCSEADYPHKDILVLLKKIMTVVWAELSKDSTFEA